MDMYSSGTSKKKMLVPLVVLMLCAVALVGAGYAYSSSVSDNGGADSDYMVIQYWKSDGSAAITATGQMPTASGFVVVTETDLSGPTVNATVDGTATIQAYFKIESDVSPAAVYSVSADFDIGDVTTANSTGTLVFDTAVTYHLASDNSAVSANTFVAGTLYYVKVVITTDDTLAFANGTAKVDALEVQTAINAATYSLEVTAANYVAP
ncbi:hypothetical protein TALC_00637 [Thermoplasmatales archaeon BRNA1]|nr:hypothetical protein TALC_00637 [Thermoplasmatales archaeon BRNA1]